MKIRTNYVSNSSSSSFLIAYDKNFFGDLLRFFKDGCFYECSFKDSTELEDYFYPYFDEEEKATYEYRIQEAENNGKTILYMSLDYNYTDTFRLLEQLNAANGGDKMEVIYRGDE